jgi:hypothetical protein
MFIAPVTITEVEEAIKILNTNSSADFDEITLSSVKQQCLCYFIKPLVHIYNVSSKLAFYQI